MTRAGESLWWRIRHLRLWRFWKDVKPAYCGCCNVWTWCTNETPAYSAHDGCFLCEECADINDKETAQAWRDYYSDRL
jgi:hypothetical protein